MGLSGALQGVASLDLAGQKSIQDIYFVHQAQTGAWQMKLTGDPGPNDTYVVSAIGSNPAPGVSDVLAVASGQNQAAVGWRITSDEATTKVSVYANSGAITTTHTITNPDGTLRTEVVPSYSGELLKTNIATPLDGRVYTTTVSLNQLPSATYNLWVEADDGRNPPVRVYATGALVVNQGGAWPATWTAQTTLTPAYRSLGLAWNRHPHPDADTYVLHVGASPLSLTNAITVGNTVEWKLESLNPGHTYYLAIEALDEATGHSSLSQVVSAVAGVASFDLVAAPGIPDVVGGRQATTVVTVSTSLLAYPDTVALYPVWTSDGAGLLPPTESIVPTTAGVAVPVVISTTNGVSDRIYTLPLLASGGGVTRTVNVQVHVLQPGFGMGLPAANQELGRGQSLQTVITTDAVHGDNRPITLHLDDAPSGLQWRFSAPTIIPGQSTTLTLTDTELLLPGIYELRVRGDNGVQSIERAIAITVQKAAFTVSASPASVWVQPGQTKQTTLSVDGIAGWTGPVTLTVDATTVPPEAEIGFVVGGSVIGQATVTASGQATLRVTTTTALPQRTYLVRVIAESGGWQQILQIELRTEGPANVIHLPLIASGYTAAP
jgi:hypothetical protein